MFLIIRVSWRDDFQLRKITPVARNITRDQRHIECGGLCADQKIRQRAGLRAAPAAIGEVRLAGQKQGARRHRRNGNFHHGKHMVERVLGRVGRRQFGIHQRIDGKFVVNARAIQLVLRLRAVQRIIAQYVDEDIGINKYHLRPNPGSFLSWS